MSFEKKLSTISANLQEDKKLKQQAEEEEKLLPIRARIKELTAYKESLEIINNSLRLKSDQYSGTGLGMEDYAKETESNIKNETGRLDKTLAKHQETLSHLGVESRDQLLSHEDFKDEEEVVAYKKAVEQGDNLKSDDDSLRVRLNDLGITIEANNFSYDTAKAALAEKLQAVNKELIEAMRQTPEGREELRAELANEFAPEAEKIFSSIGLKKTADKRTWLDGYSRRRLMPEGWQSKVDIYGPEIARAALSQSYQAPIREAINYYESKLPNELKELIKEYPTANFRNADGLRQSIAADLDLALQTQAKLLEYYQEANRLKFDLSGFDLAGKIDRLASQKKEAKDILNRLAAIQSELSPDEEVILRNGIISLSAAELAYDNLRQDIKKAEGDLKILNDKISQQEQIKPKLFGKDKWQEELDGLRGDRTRLKEKIENMSGSESRALYKKNYYYIDPDNRLFYLQDLLKEQKAQGKAADIFSDLAKELNKIISSENPPSLVKSRQEFQDLEKRLNYRI